jgi:GalNAc-alpha-(1->4)-GalNAc-alpha-(1->3)-diNAcBac-PP-undecaprenol alpha-1,4-N-acetyl-D-galactosaminyltransferase
MRVAIACVSLKGGGTERVVSSFANYLASHHSVTIVILSRRETYYPLRNSVKVLAPKGTNSKRTFLRTLAQLHHAYKSLRSIRPDACFVFGEDIGGALCLISRLARVPKVYVLNRGTPRRSLTGINGILNPYTYRLASAVFLQTAGAKAMLRERYRNTNLQVVPNQVEVPSSVTPILARPKSIVSVGSLGRKKNQAALLRIFARLEHAQGWRLLLAGEGPDRASLEKLATDLGISERVRLLGQVKDIGALLQSAQVFAFTSLEEGSPNALAEALAHGCACISYDCPTGPSDLISSDVNGILITLNDESMFKSSLDDLLASPSLRLNLSTNARQGVQHSDPNNFNRALASLL